MGLKDSEQTSSLVSAADLEVLLASVAREPGTSHAGIFGPDSITWKVDRESALFLGAGRAALLQLAHPWVTAALTQHSSLLSQPIARFHNTFRVVFTMIFGTQSQAFRSARRLHALHTQIRGELPEGVGRYERGTHYDANEIGALRWVFATLVDSGLMAYESVLPPLTAEEREKYYAEAKTMAALFGIPAHALPPDWETFTAYNKEMFQSNSLGANDQARMLAKNLLSGAGSWIRPPLWYRALTTYWIPERLREEFGLKFDADARRSAEGALHWLPKVYGKLPGFIRFVGPYQEAQRRLSDRTISATVHWSNRFWIGQAQMPPAKESILTSRPS